MMDDDNDSRPLLFITTTKTCPACTYFKLKILPVLYAHTTKEKKIRIRIQNLEAWSEEERIKLDSHSPHIRSKIIEFPSLILFDGESWNTGGDDCFIFNTDDKTKKLLSSESQLIMSPENIITWLTDKLRILEQRKTPTSINSSVSKISFRSSWR